MEEKLINHFITSLVYGGFERRKINGGGGREVLAV
jgi:hypothetical protein